MFFHDGIFMYCLKCFPLDEATFRLVLREHSESRVLKLLRFPCFLGVCFCRLSCLHGILSWFSSTKIGKNKKIQAVVLEFLLIFSVYQQQTCCGHRAWPFFCTHLVQPYDFSAFPFTTSQLAYASVSCPPLYFVKKPAPKLTFRVGPFLSGKWPSWLP